MRLTREQLAGLLPHAGAMCLLDAVLEWDAARIRCRSRTHLDRGNPMRIDGELPAACGIEYAAQAMALHGGLVAGAPGGPRKGFLASVREVACRRARLDDLPDELVVEAERLMGDEAGVIYRFTISSGGEEVMSGRAAVVLDAERGARSEG